MPTQRDLRIKKLVNELQITELLAQFLLSRALWKTNNKLALTTNSTNKLQKFILYLKKTGATNNGIGTLGSEWNKFTNTTGPAWGRVNATGPHVKAKLNNSKYSNRHFRKIFITTILRR